ncbi:MAG: hypothetical protein WBB82_15775 [Limnothrix sp.]
MIQWFKVGAIAAMISNLGFCLSVQALPGDLIDDVASWIEANPTFRGSMINNLKVTRYNTAAQKLTFEASAYSPTRINEKPSGLVRSEKLHFFDVTNGVTVGRLTEALRTVYGVNIHQDFARAREVYSYPDINTLNRAKRENLPILAAQQGRLLEGDRFAYWVEVVKSNQQTDFATRGHITVLEKGDLAALENQLSSR